MDQALHGRGMYSTECPFSFSLFVEAQPFAADKLLFAARRVVLVGLDGGNPTSGQVPATFSYDFVRCLF